MHFHAIIATIVAFITFALAQGTTTTQSTVTVTRTLMHYNATTTMYYTGTGGPMTTTHASTFRTPTLSPTYGEGASSSFKGDAGTMQGSMAAAGLMGVLALAIGAF